MSDEKSISKTKAMFQIQKESPILQELKSLAEKSKIVLHKIEIQKEKRLNGHA